MSTAAPKPDTAVDLDQQAEFEAYEIGLPLPADGLSKLEVPLNLRQPMTPDMEREKILGGTNVGWLSPRRRRLNHTTVGQHPIDFELARPPQVELRAADMLIVAPLTFRD